MNAVTLSQAHALAVMQLAPLDGSNAAPARTRSVASGAAQPSLARVLRALGTSGLPVSTLETARGALRKMAGAAALLGGAGSLESGLAALLAEQARQSDQQTALAKNQVLCKFQELKLRNLYERQQIEKRIEAAKNAGFWGKLCAFFKGLGAALAAASSIFTGPAGIAASALLVASLVVGAAAPESWGKWVSFGLSLAAMALGGYTAISNLVGAGAAAGNAAAQAASQAGKTAAETLQSGIKLGTSLGSSASSATAAGCGGAEGYHRGEELFAQAALLELRALKQKLLGEAEEEREELKAVIEAQDRGVKAVVKALESCGSAALAAMRRPS